MGGTDLHGGGHERRDVSIRTVALCALGLLAAVPLVMVGMNLLFAHLAERERLAQPQPITELPTEANPLPPEPRLQMSPVEDLRQLRTAEETALEGYGWVDRSAGRVRIPVARAIELVAERGLPVRPEAKP